jgi:transposase
MKIGEIVMLGIAMYTTIKTLWKQGHSKSEIAKLIGHDRKTVQKIIKELNQGKSGPNKKPHPSKLDPYREQILEWLEHELTATRIHEELLNLRLNISYSSVKYYIADLKNSKKICIRFHTQPGEEAQVDFGYIGLQPHLSRKRKKSWIFNMRLSYSRLDYYEIVFDQKVDTFIKCHINAFKYFGGVPKTVKIDNLKAAILEAHLYEPIYQGTYQKFSEFYGFQPLPCRVRKPQEKGKVESGIKYIKINFFKGRYFSTYADLEIHLQAWLENKCNSRTHGTTKKIPRILFDAEEKECLQRLPNHYFIIPNIGIRKVQKDCHVYVNHNYYSVPHFYMGKEVEVEISERILKVLYNGEQIAIHAVLQGDGRFSTIREHYPAYKYLSDTDYQRLYQSKMLSIGEYGEQIFIKLKEQYPYHWRQSVKGILSLKKFYKEEVINLSCKRALFYNTLQYRVIKNICQNGYYVLPLE